MEKVVKLTIFLRRRTDWSHSEFVVYHQNEHLPLFNSLPEVKQSVRKHTHFYDQEITETNLLAYDCITRLWLNDFESLYQLFGSDSYMQLIVASERKCLDMENCIINLSS